VNAEKVRFVTHRDVSRAQIDEAIERIARIWTLGAPASRRPS